MAKSEEPVLSPHFKATKRATRALESTIDLSKSFWKIGVMKSLHKLLIVAVLAASAALLAPEARAQLLSIEIGDRPYYTHGASYWNGDVQYYWAPGHWSSRHHWVRGHYVARRNAGLRLHRRHPILRIR